MQHVYENNLWLGVQRAVAFVLMLTLAPLFAVLFILTKISSPGPFLFSQERVGYGGKPFRIFKVRTMVVNAEAETRLGTTVSGNYVTKIGSVFRALKLDELPQLWNVVKGDMELVGPRPIPFALDEHLRQSIPGFELRYAVRPGLTNLGQVCVIDNEVGERLLHDWRMRFESDMHHLSRKCLAYDLVMLGLTLFYLGSRLALLSVGKKAKRGDLARKHYIATKIIDAPICNLDYSGVVDQIATWVDKKRRDYVCIVPVHSLIVGFWDRAHRAALQGAGLCTADGVPVVWAQRLLGHRGASRVYGPTLMLKALDRAQQEQWRVALYGGSPERLDSLVERLNELYPRLKLVEAISPPYRELTQDEDDLMVDRLRSARPDLVFVGLGCPKQERWMSEHRSRIPGVMLGVGAAFDFHAGAVAQAPLMLQRVGMEWAFRLAMEPRRLWKRYLTTNPVYVALATWQIFCHVLVRRNYQLTKSQVNAIGGLS